MAIHTKKEAKMVFGTYGEMAEELGISRQALSKWPNELTKRQVHEVEGAILARKRRMLLALQSCDDLIDEHPE